MKMTRVPIASILSSARWRTRLTLWIAAVVAGLVVVGFAKLAERALDVFFSLYARFAWLPFLLAPAIGMLSVWCTLRIFPGAQGSGIPQVIAARRLAASGQAVHGLVSLRLAVGKVLVGAFALLGGFSSGREGPSVQIAASILHAAHRWLPYSRAVRASDLILAGGAAGIAAAFNTPLAGIVFAIEELGRRLEARTSGVLLSTIIFSGMVSVALLGNYNYFGNIKVAPQSIVLAVPVLLGGIVCGLLGGLFSYLMQLPQNRPTMAAWIWRRKHPIAFAGICGLLVAIIGWAGGGLSFGSGYSITSQAVSGDITLPWHAPITRYLATLASYYSGIPGGIFAPALAVGGALGSVASGFFGEIGNGALMAIFMAGFLAAVTQSPLTSAIIVMEMIDGHEMVIALIAVAFLAKIVSARLSPELYQQLAISWLGRQKTAVKPALD
jgi:H+/Cl- antiporter ClcA